jgi:hypothetical protein
MRLLIVMAAAALLFPQSGTEMKVADLPSMTRVQPAYYSSLPPENGDYVASQDGGFWYCDAGVTLTADRSNDPDIAIYCESQSGENVGQ